jgi:hypothetical protein
MAKANPSQPFSRTAFRITQTPSYPFGMPFRLVSVLVAVGIASAVDVIGLGQTGPATLPFRIAPLVSPAPPGSAQPHLSVSSRGVLMSWIERAGAVATLKFAARTPAGWTTPRTVASGDNWFVNWADVPSVLRLPNGTIVAHWLQKSGPGTYAYDVRLTYSKDNGRTFANSFLPHHDGTKTEHGFASLFAMNNGVGLVWLDGRATGGGQDAAQQAPRGAMTLRFAAFDGVWKQIADLPVDEKVCDCCPTTAVMTADGPIAAYRDRSDQEIRDIHVSRFEKGAWTPSKAVANDNWHITGCPVNGPMLAARGRDVVLTWFTGSENQPRTLAAFSNDAGRTFGSPIRIDDNGTLGRVDAELLPDGSAIVSWIEHANRVAEFKIRRIDASGKKSAAVSVATISGERASGYPRIAVHGQELVLAWVDLAPGRAGGPAQAHVRTAVSALPPAR